MAFPSPLPSTSAEQLLSHHTAVKVDQPPQPTNTHSQRSAQEHPSSPATHSSSIPATPLPASPVVYFPLLGGYGVFLCYCTIAGIADCAGFLGLDSLFVSHTTGNIVLTATLVAHSDSASTSWWRLILIPFFFLGSFVTTGVAIIIQSNTDIPRAKHVTLLVLQGWATAMHSICWAVAVSYQSYLLDAATANTFHVLLVGCLLTFTIGQQLSIASLYLLDFPPTSMMTGNVTTVSSELVHSFILGTRLRYIHRHDDQPKQNRQPVDGILGRDHISHPLPPSPPTIIQHDDHLHQLRATERQVAHRKLGKSASAVVAFSVGCVLGGVLLLYCQWHVLAVTWALSALVSIDVLVGCWTTSHATGKP